MRWRHDLEREEHPAVVDPAQLTAVTGERACLVRGDREVVRVARDDVPLEQELRYPERVDHVRRGQVELDGLALGDLQHRQVLLARRKGRVPHRAVLGDPELRVVELPAPLEADHVHGHLRVLRNRVDRVLVLGRVVEQHGDQDERDDRVKDLDRHVVADLRRQLVTALAVEDNRPHDQAPDDTTNEHSGDPRPLPERDNNLALFGHGVRETYTGERVVRAPGERKQHDGKRANARRLSTATARSGAAPAWRGLPTIQSQRSAFPTTSSGPHLRGRPRSSYSVSCIRYRGLAVALRRPPVLRAGFSGDACFVTRRARAASTRDACVRPHQPGTMENVGLHDTAKLG